MQTLLRCLQRSKAATKFRCHWIFVSAGQCALSHDQQFSWLPGFQKPCSTMFWSVLLAISVCIVWFATQEARSRALLFGIQRERNLKPCGFALHCAGRSREIE